MESVVETFQFLIGRLQTLMAMAGPASRREFQFLIGRLQTQDRQGPYVKILISFNSS